jgi:tRNA(fMet)-specific endonuclease VapC
MGALIDSSVLIDAERGKLDLAELNADHERETLSISAITASELLHGVHRAISTSQKAKRQAFVEAMLARMPVLPFDLITARIHAELWAKLAKRGARIGEIDLIIRGFKAILTADRQSWPATDQNRPGLSKQGRIILIFDLEMLSRNCSHNSTIPMIGIRKSV